MELTRPWYSKLLRLEKSLPAEQQCPLFKAIIRNHRDLDAALERAAKPTATERDGLLVHVQMVLAPLTVSRLATPYRAAEGVATP